MNQNEQKQRKRLRSFYKKLRRKRTENKNNKCIFAPINLKNESININNYLKANKMKKNLLRFGLLSLLLVFAFTAKAQDVTAIWDFQHNVPEGINTAKIGRAHV